MRLRFTNSVVNFFDIYIYCDWKWPSSYDWDQYIAMEFL